MNQRRQRRLPELDSVEYVLLLAGLIVMVAFSLVSAAYQFSVAWLMPVIFLALYMILRVLVPLRAAEPRVRDFRDQISALERRLDALQVSLAATPVQYHVDNNEFYGNLAGRIRSTARTRVDVTYFRKVPPSAFAQEKSQQYFRSLIEWAGEDSARIVRRIIGVHNDEMREWARQHWAETRNTPNYEARVIEYQGKPDMLNMALIDDRHVYLAFSGETNQSMSGLDIDDARACQYFTRYYDQNWHIAIPLKDWADHAEPSRRRS